MADFEFDLRAIAARAEKLRAHKTLLVSRCPHCSVANPSMPLAWGPEFTRRADGRMQEPWAIYICSTCGGVVSVRCSGSANEGYSVEQIFPQVPQVAKELPEPAHRYLKQATETLASPDAAAIMAGSAVDAMLKHLKFTEGSVYHRIEQAVDANVLTESMGEWAHSVRLGSNRPRHADSETPHVSAAEAAQSVEFATALGHFLFVLTARVERGIAQAQATAASTNK